MLLVWCSEKGESWLRAHFCLLRPRSLRDLDMSEVLKKTISDEATVTLLALVEGFIALWRI